MPRKIKMNVQLITLNRHNEESFEMKERKKLNSMSE